MNGGTSTSRLSWPRVKNANLSIRVLSAAALLCGCASYVQPGSRCNTGDRSLIDWDALRNPILALPDRMLKDQSVIYHRRSFYIYASQRFEGKGEAGTEAVFFRTTDFRNYDQLFDEDITGGSPHVVSIDGTWHVTTQRSHGGDSRRIYHSVSSDAENWTAAKEIAAELRPHEVHIDGALARVDDGHYYLTYKERVGQLFYVARSIGAALDGRWHEPNPCERGS